MPVVGIKVKATTPVLRIWIASTLTLCPLSKKYIYLHHRTRTRRKKCEQKAIMQDSDSTLSPRLSLLLGVASDIGKSSSTPAKVDKKHENSVESDNNSKTKKTGTSVSKGSGKKSPAKNPKPTTDFKLEQLDQIWSERFSRLEAMLLSKTFNQPDPVFQFVVGPTAKPPPAGALDKSSHSSNLRPTN